MDLEGISVILGFGYPAGMDFHDFLWIYMDLERISVILGLGCRIPCGGLWRAVAACGSLWRPVAESCGPYILPCSVLGACRLAGWCLAGWLDGWMAGWLDGRLAGWLDGWMVGITAVT